MAADFPSSPTLNQTYTFGGRTWKWNGTGWALVANSISTLALSGATSGAVTLQAAAVAGTNTVTFPATTGTVVTTGDSGTVTSTMIADGTIVNGDVNASAAIAGTKIAPDFGAQNVVTTGTSTAASFSPTSSTAPTNGVYLPAANSLGLSTNGSPRVTVDSSGRVLIGTTNSRASSGVTPAHFQEGALTYEAFGVCSNGGTIADRGAYVFLSRSRGTTLGSSTIVANGDTLGGIAIAGADGTDVDTAAAAIYGQVDGTPNANVMPGRLVFATTAAGAGAASERARITSDGYLRLAASGIQFNGDTAAANALNDYEEGTWTPTLPNGGTLTTLRASYTKIGRVVSVNCYLSALSPTNNASILQIGGLPFTSNSITSEYAVIGGRLAYTGGAAPQAWTWAPTVPPNATYVYFINGSVNVTNGAWAVSTSNGLACLFGVQYIV